jgi:hypothetical protein
MLCVAIRLLLLGSRGCVCPVWAVSPSGSSKSGDYLAFVICSVKHLVSVGKGHLRGWSATGGIRGVHNRHVSRGGCSNQCWVRARLHIHDAELPLPWRRDLWQPLYWRHRRGETVVH